MQHDADLARFVEQMYERFSSGKPDLADDLVSADPGVLGIGTDPAEWWVAENVLRAFKAQIPEMHAAGMRFQPGAVVAYSEGPIGWVADQPSLRMPDGSEIPMRMTAVWRRDGDAWKMLQFHLSMGVSNQEALDTDLTT